MRRSPFVPATTRSRRARARRPAARPRDRRGRELPPMVPRLRIAGWATCGMAAATSGRCFAISTERSSSAWRVSAPMRRVLLGADGVELGDPVDVDDRPRRGQAQVERGHQALAAGQESRIGMLAQQRDGMLHRASLRIGERRGLHGRPPVFDCRRLARRVNGRGTRSAPGMHHPRLFFRHSGAPRPAREARPNGGEPGIQQQTRNFPLDSGFAPSGRRARPDGAPRNDGEI